MNSNQLLSQLANLSWAKIALGCILAGGIYYAAFFDDGSSLIREIQNAKSQTEEAEKQLKSTKAAFDDAKKFEGEVKTLLEQFQGVLRFMPPQFSMVDMTTMISDIASKTGVHLMSTQPENGVAKTDFYDSARLTFAIEGHFTELAQFLSLLSRIPRLMTFDKVVVSHEEANGRKDDPENPILKLEATLVAYRYIGDPKTNLEAEPAKNANPNQPAGASQDGATPAP